MYICIYIHMHVGIPLLCQLRGPRSNNTPVATSTLSAQILISNNLSPIKGTREPWRNG